MCGKGAKSVVVAPKLKAIKEGTIFVAGYNNVFLSVYYCTLRAIAIVKVKKKERSPIRNLSRNWARAEIYDPFYSMGLHYCMIGFVK